MADVLAESVTIVARAHGGDPLAQKGSPRAVRDSGTARPTVERPVLLFHERSPGTVTYATLCESNGQVTWTGLAVRVHPTTQVLSVQAPSPRGGHRWIPTRWRVVPEEVLAQPGRLPALWPVDGEGFDDSAAWRLGQLPAQVRWLRRAT